MDSFNRERYWIWYPGDFELYHAMKQNFSRVERGMGWPAFWKSEGFRNRVAFRRTYELKEETSFLVSSKAVGFVLVEEAQRQPIQKKYPFGQRIVCGPGTVRISVHAARIEALPSIYIEGTEIFSDSGWMAEDYDRPPVSAGTCKYFTKPEQDPSVWDYTEKEYQPVCVEEVNGGVLCEFETELTAQIVIERDAGVQGLRVYCGESRSEALDVKNCYYSWQPDADTGRCPRCAVRYAYIPGCPVDGLRIRAIHQYVDIPIRASFSCGDELLKRIWDTAAHTFQLCSGIFFIDGIKRDKWIWSGDAYQSILVNQYLMRDPDIDRRTLLALRGNDPMTTHINTIVDYSLFWILGVRAHCEAYGDTEFLRDIYPKMISLMEFCGKQLDDRGFLIGREKDWIYIDWADMEKEGPVCALQMLFAACYDAMAWAAETLGSSEAADAVGKRTDKSKHVTGSFLKNSAALYHERYENLVQTINTCFWDEAQGAYIDSLVSGNAHVTRHANIFAIRYGIADRSQQEKIVANVLKNDRIPAITTPYFKFYELDVLGMLGYLDDVMETIRSYWGGMLERGAVTFWEEYDPEVVGEAQYDMYGDRFGKSLCHAWAASPIYLLSKYFRCLEDFEITVR